ncbi:MAG: HEPN domain-containing protein [Candidatus Bathyarchaeia archaeon]
MGGKEYWLREAREWFSDAERDFREAEDRLSAEVYTEACFHSHQAAEKIIKAVYYSRGEVIIGHDLEGLLSGLEKYGLEVRDLMDDARELNPHYMTARYPDARRRYGLTFEDYNRDLAEECFRRMKRIWKRIKGSLILE